MAFFALGRVSTAVTGGFNGAISPMLTVWRKLNLEYPGAIYHQMNRGDLREPIFSDGTDRQSFLETLGRAAARPIGK